MKPNNLLFILDGFLPYVRDEIEKSLIEESWLFNAVSYTYLPVIRMCGKLKNEGIPFKLGAVFEPALCDMLEDPFLQDRYLHHIEKKISFAKKELERCASCSKTRAIIEFDLNLFNKNKELFTACGKNILKKFDELSKEGYIELLATTATRCFLPFFKDMPEAVAAQIEMGQISFRRHFSSVPAGFWLPALGFAEGLETIIRRYGFDYTVLSSKAFLLADAVPDTGVFSAAVSECGLKLLACDTCAYQRIYGGSGSFAANPVYRDCENDAGFKLSKEYLASFFDTSKGRREIGFRYWSKKEPETIYDMEEALGQAKADAQTFVSLQEQTLNEVSRKTDCKTPVSVFLCSSDFFGNKWCEGIMWLEQTLRLIHKSESLKTVFPDEAVRIEKNPFKLKPFLSSIFYSGYADELITGKSDWMYRYIMKTTGRMIDLAERFPKDSLVKESVLNAAAREVFLLQSYYWPLYAAEGTFREFAKRRFIEHVNSFTHAYEALGADVLPAKWLAEREAKYPIFQDINYRFFSCKK